MIFNFFLLILIFLFLTNLKINIFSFPVFYFFVPLGAAIFILDLFSKKESFLVNKNFIFLFFYFFTALFFYSFTILFNQNFDLFYLREVYLYSFFCFFFCYFFVKLFISKYSNYDNLILFFIIANSIQLVISFVLYFDQNLFDKFFSFFNPAIGVIDNLESFNEQRMIAIGNPFFGAAILNSFSLVLIATNFNKTNHKNLYAICFFIISILGIMSARTTAVSFSLAMIFIIFTYLNFFKRYFLIFLIFLIFSKNNSRFSNILDFSFGFLFDFQQSQAQDSATELRRMWQVIPENFKTWLFGDGFFRNLLGGYYKSIDIGYLRIIYSGGVLSLSLFIFIHLFLIFKIKFINKNAFLLLCSIVFFFLNIKGVANLIPFLILFFTFFNLNRRASV